MGQRGRSTFRFFTNIPRILPVTRQNSTARAMTAHEAMKCRCTTEEIKRRRQPQTFTLTLLPLALSMLCAFTVMCAPALGENCGDRLSGCYVGNRDAESQGSETDSRRMYGKLEYRASPISGQRRLDQFEPMDVIRLGADEPPLRGGLSSMIFFTKASFVGKHAMQIIGIKGLAELRRMH
jgi:hypothetical protein